MLAQERREKILQYLYKDNLIKVAEIKDVFNVSAETIRRDLEYLENEGLLKKVYGGAVLPKKSLEPSYQTRKIKNLKEKKEIAARTVELIKNGDAIIIDLGTTTLEVAKRLNTKKDLTVITNSIKVALEIDLQNNKVILIGGYLREGELSVSGFLTERNLQHFNVDKCIIGVGGISLDGGITDYHVEESQTRKLMISQAETVIAVTDFSKFGIKAFTNICATEDIDILITDHHIEQKTIKQYQERGVKVIVASSN